MKSGLFSYTSHKIGVDYKSRNICPPRQKLYFLFSCIVFFVLEGYDLRLSSYNTAKLLQFIKINTQFTVGHTKIEEYFRREIIVQFHSSILDNCRERHM